MRKFVSTGIIAALLSGCATMPAPRNVDGSYYSVTQTPEDHMMATRCHMAPVPGIIQRYDYAPGLLDQSIGDRLNPGDSVALAVAGDSEILSKTYVINGGGSINVSGRMGLNVRGMTVAQAEAAIRTMLIRDGLIRDLPNNVRLVVQEMGGINVAVNGAVFESGVKRVGERQAQIRAVNQDNSDVGDANIGRTISTSLRAAGGVRPDADLRTIYIVRDTRWTQVDLSGAVYGSAVEDFQLQDGDQIIVPSVGCFQETQVRPSSVTAPGIRIYISNLTRPANNNAGAAIGRQTTSMPYGSRLSQAMFGANCVGGSAMNAGRQIVLFSRNPINGKSVVISRSIEAMVRNSDRDGRDPYLMPGDAIACYDSFAMNLRDVVSVIGETATPFLFFNSLD